MKDITDDQFKILLGQRIRSLRDDAGFNQESFALKCGFVNEEGLAQQSRLSQYELGKRLPNAIDLLAIANALSVEVSDLFPSSTIYVKKGPIFHHLKESGVSESTNFTISEHAKKLIKTVVTLDSQNKLTKGLVDSITTILNIQHN